MPPGPGVASDDDYRAALASLRATWREKGRPVERFDSDITAILDGGMRVALSLNRYDGQAPSCAQNGTCTRYRHNYSDHDDYTYDTTGDGRVGEGERPQ